MRIKVFSAAHLHEALAKVRQSMGPEAIILDRQQTRDGSGNSLWHVHAALDSEPLNNTPAPRGQTASPIAESVSRQARHSTEATVRRLERIIDGLGRRETSGLRDSLAATEEKRAFDRLLQLGVSASHAFDMASDFALGKPAGSKSMAWGSRINLKRKQNTLLFCGPSGAGKTTLVAKIAAHYSLKGVRVALVSTDTERMGGVETLQGYATTLGIPLLSLRRPADIANIRARCESAQLLLIDSEGWSPRHSASLKRQAALWNDMACTRRFLVLPANMDEEDGMQLFARPQTPDMTDIAFTKLDETQRPGKIINWSIASGLPLGYCSFGPEVPEQMGWLTPAGITSLLGSQDHSHRQQVAS